MLGKFTHKLHPHLIEIQINKTHKKTLCLFNSFIYYLLHLKFPQQGTNPSTASDSWNCFKHPSEKEERKNYRQIIKVAIKTSGTWNIADEDREKRVFISFQRGLVSINEWFGPMWSISHNTNVMIAGESLIVFYCSVISLLFLPQDLTHWNPTNRFILFSLAREKIPTEGN